jgi:hypothetical protein
MNTESIIKVRKIDKNRTFVRVNNKYFNLYRKEGILNRIKVLKFLEVVSFTVGALGFLGIWGTVGHAEYVSDLGYDNWTGITYLLYFLISSVLMYVGTRFGSLLMFNIDYYKRMIQKK